MPVTFHCPYCGTEQTAAEQLIGRRVRCPGCDQLVQVDDPGRAQSPPLPSAAAAGRPHKPAQQQSVSRREAMRQPKPQPVAAQASSAPLPPVDFRKGRSRVIEAEMDMTPMVDVVFNLLIFFMVTAAFSLQKSLEIPKPEQSDQPSTQTLQVEDDPDYVVIIVDEHSTYQVTTPEWERECPSQQELLVQLREAKRGSGGRTPTKVLVKAHGNASHGRVVTALDSATAVGFEQVQLTTVEDL